MSKVKRRRNSARSLSASDSFRAIVGTVVLSVFVVAGLLLAQGDTTSPAVIFMVITLGWSAFAISTIMLIWVGFRKLGHDALRGALVHRRRAWWVEALLGMGGPTTWVVSVSLMALFVTLMSLMQPSGNVVSQLVAATCAVMSWLLVVFVQALAYARLDLVGDARGVSPSPSAAAADNVRFLQEEQTTFFDYLAMAFAVQATFTHPAVEIKGRRARNLVVQHQVVGFVFNTIIIAVLVALLLANVGSA